MAEEENPYKQWPIRPFVGTETEKPTGAPAAAATPTVAEAVKSHLPGSIGEVWNDLVPRAGYVGRRFVHGVEQGSDIPAPWGKVDVGKPQDMITETVGNYAENFGRNPFLTAFGTIAAPGLTAADAAWSTAASRLGLPEWERLLGGAALGLKSGAGVRLADLWNTLRHGAIGAGVGHALFGTTGAKIGAVLEGGLPLVRRVGSRIINNPITSAMGSAYGAYGAEPEGGPLLNELTTPRAPLIMNLQ